MKKIKRWLQREVISAVHDDDLEAFLDSIGILEKIQRGEFHCLECGDTVELDELGAVLPMDDKICVLCARPKCMAELDEELAKHE